MNRDFTLAKSQAAYRIVHGSLGEMLLRAERLEDDDAESVALTGVFFSGQKYHPGVVEAQAAGPGVPSNGRIGEVLDLAEFELRQYFSGNLRAFSVPLRFRGSGFQQRVWQALSALRFGETTSYGALAVGLGLGGTHARAIGGAVGRNPLSVIVPCHRVVGATGHLTGYAGGVPRKIALLQLEGSAP